MGRITIKRARTWRYRRMPLYIGQSSATESLSPCLFYRAFIIGTGGYDFRKGQGMTNIMCKGGGSAKPVIDRIFCELWANVVQSLRDAFRYLGNFERVR